jgi:FkbM family methyltransferase
MKNIIIVYYVFINPKRDWKKIIKGQIGDLLISGLLAKSKVFVHITDTTCKYIPECVLFINKLIENVEFRSNNTNEFEYPGFKWLYELAQEYPDSAMLYLHTKGMVYHHKNERNMCEKTILRYTIDNWEKTMEVFDNNKIVNKIGVYPSAEGWLWFNFFWVRSDYLQNSNPPEYTPDNRYYYESYIGREAPLENKGCGDCYSLVENKVGVGYEQFKLFEMIYDNSIYNYDMRRLPGGEDVNIRFNQKWYSFFYGNDYTKVNIDELIYKEKIVFIPNGDNERAKLFGDPEFGTHKYVFIKNIFGETTRYSPNCSIYLDLYHDKLYTVDELPDHVKNGNIHGKLKNIHSKLKINYGNFEDEYPEQLMSTRYIKGHEKVLEIGANIGRNTLIIASLLNDSSNFVTLECDPQSYNKLIENKNLNNFKFHAESAALSSRKLIQKDWDTIPSETILEGYTQVNTITLRSLKEKYQIEFDTLVLDCEGAFYYILMDYPEILTGINLIIMENDYHDISHKEYLDRKLKENGFVCDYSEKGGWGPCENYFFQVWKLYR